ncbi:MAG: hypothetical protein K6G52_01400 [Treponemataceae bacterium]|nr:hypothetical protein [Treponemataceae bacterium]
MTVLKRVLFVLGVGIAASFAIFAGLCFFVFDAPELELSTPAAYKFLTGMKWFFDFCPAILFTGITIGYSFAFGRAHIVKKERFSQSFGVYLKQIVLVSLCSTALCFVAKEIGIPLIENRQVKLVERSENLREYLSLAQESYDEQDYGMASFYIKSALEINSKHQEAVDLNIKIETRLAEEQNIPIVKSPQEKKKDSISIGNRLSATKLIKQAQECFEKEDYINAHYYANQAYELCNEHESNKTLARKIALESWSKLSETKSFYDDLPASVFAEKKEAYNALASGDYSKAYYDFSDLRERYPRDNDIQKYYAQAKEKLSSVCFFIDETENLQEFEQYNHIWFTVKNENNGKDVIAIEGVTTIKSTENMIMYLRQFSVASFDENENLVRTISVPYAKLVSQPLESLSKPMIALVTQNYKTNLVPCIFLKSVDRLDKSIYIEPVYTFYDENGKVIKNSDKKTDFTNFYIVPVSLEQFSTLCDVSDGINRMNLLPLIHFSKNSGNFGYPQEIIGYALLNRTMYPLILFICFIFCGIIAWHTRLFTSDSFKFSWIFIFPFLVIFSYFLLKVLLYFIGLVFFALVSTLGIYSFFVALAMLLFGTLAIAIRFVSVK